MAESSVEEEGEDGCLAAVAESQNRQKQMRRPHALPFQFIVDTGGPRMDKTKINFKN
jgi:hypothetical protein